MFCHKDNSCVLYTRLLLFILGSEKFSDERKKFLYSWYIIEIMIYRLLHPSLRGQSFHFPSESHSLLESPISSSSFLVLWPTSKKQWRKTSIGVRYNLI